MAFIIALSILLLLGVLQAAVPYLIKRTVVFGVTIPEQHIRDSRVVSYKKQYLIITSFMSLLFIGGFCFWVMLRNPSEDLLFLVSTIIEFAIIFISLALYFYFHQQTKSYKAESDWSEQLKQVGVVDLSVRTEDHLAPWYIYLFPMIVTIGLIGYTILQYDLLPDQIPTHWGVSGEPDAFTDKTPFTAIQLPIFLLLLQFMFIGIQFGMKFSGIKLSATNLQASKQRQLTLRKSTSWFSFFTVLLLTMLFAYFQLTTIHPEMIQNSLMKIILPSGTLILILVGTIILVLKVGLSDKKTKQVAVEDSIMDLDDDRYWKAGLFYFNKNDPSIFVEKRFGIGWTINFANPIGYLIIFGPLIIILLITYVLN